MRAFSAQLFGRNVLPLLVQFFPALQPLIQEVFIVPVHHPSPPCATSTVLNARGASQWRAKLPAPSPHPPASTPRNRGGRRSPFRPPVAPRPARGVHSRFPGRQSPRPWNG